GATLIGQVALKRHVRASAVQAAIKNGSISEFTTLLRRGDPYGNRTRVSAVKGPRPRPLDEGAVRSAASWRESARRGLEERTSPVNPLSPPRRHLPDEARPRAGCPSRRA